MAPCMKNLKRGRLREVDYIRRSYFPSEVGGERGGTCFLEAESRPCRKVCEACKYVRVGTAAR